jgi:hypothetical protein
MLTFLVIWFQQWHSSSSAQRLTAWCGQAREVITALNQRTVFASIAGKSHIKLEFLYPLDPIPTIILLWLISQLSEKTGFPFVPACTISLLVAISCFHWVLGLKEHLPIILSNFLLKVVLALIKVPQPTWRFHFLGDTGPGSIEQESRAWHLHT